MTKYGIRRASIYHGIYEDADIKFQVEDLRQEINLPPKFNYREVFIDGEEDSWLYFVVEFGSLDEFQNFITQVRHRAIIGVADEEQSKFFDYELTIYDSWVE